jgi:hypothetical protein
MLNATNTEAAELVTLIRIETRSQNLRLAALESELARALTPPYSVQDEQLAQIIREELQRVDRALMELVAGRLPGR